MNDSYDILIRNGQIVDGSGTPWFSGDVALRDDRIAAIGMVEPLYANRVIEARGKIVCPGFIDLHTHADLAHLADPDASPRVMQGVTTDVLGQDGLSYAPVTANSLEFFVNAMKAINGKPESIDYSWRTVDEFLDRFDRTASINVAYLLPHGPVRYMAMNGAEDRRPTESEMRRMREIVVEAMHAGAAGFSTALTYAPCSFADRGELVELCREVARFNAPFMPHLRSYGAGAQDAMEEAVDIARRSGVALHLTHHQVVFPLNEHHVQDYLDIIDNARAEGIDVTCGSYPYIAGSTFVRGLLPSWSQRMSPSEFSDALRDPVLREKIRHEVEDVGCDGSHGVPMDWSRIQISGVKTAAGSKWVGWRVSDAARESGMSTFDFLSELLIAEEGEIACVSFFGYEHGVQAIMQHPAHLVESDAIMNGARPHPRAWGCHARYLARYVRDLGILRWEEAIRKMTAAPAARIGLSDRGLLKKGLAADVVVFDPATVQDTATFDDPKQHPTGIHYVIVNGEIVVDNGVHTQVRSGRALRRS